MKEKGSEAVFVQGCSQRYSCCTFILTCSAWQWQGQLSERRGALAALSPCCPSESQPRIDLAGCSNPLFPPSRLLQAFLSAPSQLALICAPSAPACASKPRHAIILHRHCHRSSLPRRCNPPHLSSAASLPGATSNLAEPHGLLRSSFTFPSFTRPCPQTSPVPLPQGCHWHLSRHHCSSALAPGRAGFSHCNSPGHKRCLH